MNRSVWIPFLAISTLSGLGNGFRSPEIAVSVNGTRVSFPVGQPMEWKGHVMVPLRGVFEQMGGKVLWNSSSQSVSISRGSSTIKMTVGESHALKNDETIVTDVKSILRNGTCYVPLRFLAEAIDASVHWDGATRSVDITTQKA